MKKKKSIIILCVIFFTNSHNLLFAEETKTSPYSLEKNYSLYKERVINICNEYKTKKELINIEDTYEEID
jgi:hypothetical protein